MAAFTLTLSIRNTSCLSSRALGDEDPWSAMDRIRHLTSIVGQMMCSEIMAEPLAQIETSYDRTTDRWQNFRGVGVTDRKEYVFDESHSRWKTL